jgi:hypothetical protein
VSVQEPVSDAVAIARYPELAQLVAIRQVGWIFRPLHDEADQLIGIAGSWTRQRYTDALLIFDRNHVITSRVLADGHGDGCVWMREGNDIQEAITDLLALPEPGQPGAPSLAIRVSSLWTP